MTTTEQILTLAGALGVSGGEDGAVEAAQQMLAPLGACERAPLGSLLCRIKPVPASGEHVMLTAHIDSVGMIVTYIDDGGFLRVSNVGGIDRALLLAAQVVVHTAKGELPGVVCTVPPHLNSDDTHLPKIEDISIDVGLSAEEARERIAPGDRVTFCCEARELMNGRISTRAADDRAGCAAVILAAEKLAGRELSCGLSVALTTLEEVGGQGAATAANILSPTHAVAVDVSFGHTPDCPRAKCGEMGGGPMVGVAPVIDNGMSSRLREVAVRENIPFQVEVMGGRTGTDVDGIAVSGAGVRCALVSIPQRYMHTPVEVVHVSDVEAAAELIAAYVADAFGGVR